MSNSERLALRREPDKSFVPLGRVTADTKSDVTIIASDGSAETYPRRGLVFVTIGSLNFFARLDPDSLQRAFAESPQSVFEQALVDSNSPLSTADLKQKLVQAGLAVAGVETTWDAVRKSLEANTDIKTAGQGSAKRFSWKGAEGTRLRPYVVLPAQATPWDLDVDDDATTDETASASVSLKSDATNRPVPAEPDEQSWTGDPAILSSEVAQAPLDTVQSDSSQDELLLETLSRILGPAAPRSMEEIPRSILRIGAALSHAAAKDLKPLGDVPEVERHLVTLMLLARERPTRSGPAQALRLDPETASEAIEAAIGEASRLDSDGRVLARFASRVLERTDLGAVPLPLIAMAFIRAVQQESTPDPGQEVLDLAGALADRTSSSISHEWDQADPLIRDVARGMNRLPLDEAGPRSGFLAALYDIRREHLDSNLLWKNLDLDALDRSAGGRLRRALLDPHLAERVVRPEVVRFVSECRTRHDLGKLFAFRGSFAQFVSAHDIAAVMRRLAKEDRIASEWYAGLSQQSRLDEVARERDSAIQDAAAARMLAEDSAGRAAKALADRETALASLKRASEANAQASDAQLRQAKVDVLRSLAGVAVTVGASAAAQEDPVLLQRLSFALQREGLTEIAAPGEVVTYDPALHDAQGEHIEPGASVSVGRSGYTYTSGDESLVLVKAHVSVT